MAAELDGPRLAPRSGRTRQLVVLLHGYGADGNDLIEIGKVWQQLLPDARSFRRMRRSRADKLQWGGNGSR